jgi:hypothetical protein
MTSREAWLEVGLLAFIVAMIGGAGIALAGRRTESANRRRWLALPPPARGDVSHRSHQNIASSAAR